MKVCRINNEYKGLYSGGRRSGNHDKLSPVNVGVRPGPEKDGPDDAGEGGEECPVEGNVGAAGDNLRLDRLCAMIKVGAVDGDAEGSRLVVVDATQLILH